jgi:Ni/Fe-hydrogenase subunit HybB-like protein
MIAIKNLQLSDRARHWLTALGALWGITAIIAVVRFTQGLGAVTALSDRFPWGLWIGVDVLCGVALAAGGFVVAGSVHIFGVRRFHSVLRPAVLTAFIGYLLVIAALMFDLGRWYNIWHPIIMWQPHSVMFEVAWCVMLYTVVLALEFSPVALEGMRWYRPLRIVQRVTLPLVIAGVILSTLHQSSLGSLFLIIPTKLSALWYSPLLPVFFFISAVAVGPAMVIVESTLSSRAFRRSLENDVLATLGKVSAWVLVLYLALKLADLTLRGSWAHAVIPTLQAGLFWAEITGGVLLPALLLFNPRVRNEAMPRFWSAVLIVSGVVLNRLNVSIFGLWQYKNAVYIPTIGEILITLSLIAAGVGAFAVIAALFPVFPAEEERPHHA